MKINILSGQGNLNILMGFITDPEMKDLYIELEKLSTIDKNIYNNFFLEFGDYTSLTILNCTISVDSNRVTTNNVSTENLEIDFNTLDNDQKLNVEQFLDLLGRI
jgi:hypothetical protein